jgi:hypothetical protein
VEARNRPDANARSAPETINRNPAPSKVGAPARPGTENSGARRVEKQDVTPEPLGYVGDPPTSSPPARPLTRSTVPPPPRQAEPPTPPAAGPKARTRQELEQHQGLRQSMGDVLRIGLAEDIAEVRPGLLAVFLAPGGMNLPSATYNLQRLYLAYSDATREADDVTLELRLHDAMYARFTGEGLIPAASR